MPSTAQSDRYERNLDHAHRALYWASVNASENGWEGASEDCMQLLAEIQRLMDDSLSGRRRTALRIAG